MRVLITGAAGMLGQDVVAATRAAGIDPVPLTLAELDITDRSAVESTIAAEHPDVLVNCAAWTDVDGAESDPDAALAVNGAAAGHLARAAAAAGAWTVHISTDYVFDGTGNEPYVESDQAAPVSAYGRTKLAGELEVAREAPASHTIVRSSWLFGAGGPCFPATIMARCGELEKVKVVDDQIGCPTFTGHLARAIVGLAATAPPAGIVHLTGSGSCSWYEFACQIVTAAGLECEVSPCSTAEMPRPAQRPAYSVLGTERAAEAPRLPGWREGLDEYIALRVPSP
jgi:dTDP-4-dehydrorhamnose reductase